MAAALRLKPAVVKVTFCLRRRPDLSREQFQAHWREVHAPLVVARSPIFIVEAHEFVPVRAA